MKKIPYGGILAVGNDQHSATENYRLLALGQNVAAFRDEAGTVSFISNSSSSSRVMFNPHNGQADLEHDDSLIADLDFVSESSDAVAPAMYAVCSDGCGHHFVFDEATQLKFCPICTCSVSTAGEADANAENNGAEGGSGSSDEDEATKLLDGIGTPAETSESSEDTAYEGDDEDGESEDDMSLEDDVEEALSGDGEGDESEESEDDLSDLEEDDSDEGSDGETSESSSAPRYIVAAGTTVQGALAMFLRAPGMSVSSGDKQNVEYMVCSSDQCGAHIMHNAPSLTQCPACLSAVVEPASVPDESFNLNQLMADVTQVQSISGEGEGEDDGSDSDLPDEDTDADDGEGGESEDGSTSESSSMKTATAFSKAGAMARFRDMNLEALVSTSSADGQVPVQYVVCSDADCGAHIVSESAQHFCPVCSASTEEPKSDDEAANIVGDLEADDESEEDEDADDGGEVDLDLDEDEEGDDSGESEEDADSGDDEDLDLGDDEEEGGDDAGDEGEEDPDADAEGSEDEGDGEASESTSSIQVDAAIEPAATDAQPTAGTAPAVTDGAPAAAQPAATAPAVVAADAVADTQINALDLINDAKAEAHASLDLVFNPSISGAAAWTAYYDGMPVAMARVEDLPANAKPLFDQPTFHQAVIATARQLSVKQALTELGFKSLVHTIPVSASLSALVDERVAVERAQMTEKTEQYADRYLAAHATAAIGINRGFFKIANPLKAALCSTMEAAGVKNPEAAVDKVFANHFDQFAKSVQAKAVEIVAQPAEVQTSLASAVLDVNYQSTSGAHAAPVEEQLATIGVSVSKDAAAIKPVPASSGTHPAMVSQSSDDFQALMSKAVGRLGAPRR